MPSYTEEHKRKAVETVEECGGSVTRAIRRLGYPSRQTIYQWLNQRDASHERRAGRPWSHYDLSTARISYRCSTEQYR